MKLFDEKELFNKEIIFYDDNDMMENIINRVKKYIENKKKKIRIKEWNRLATNMPEICNGKIVWSIIYNDYRNNDNFLKEEIRNNALSKHFLSFFDRITCKTSIESKRKEWLPEQIYKGAKRIYENKENEFENLNKYKWNFILNYTLEEIKKHIDIYVKMPIDWEILAAINSNNLSNSRWINDYCKYALSPNIEIDNGGEKKIINPRREFFINYPIIAINSFIMRDEILEKIDNLEPLNGIHFYSGKNINFKFTNSVMKYLNGRYLPEKLGNNLFLSILSYFHIEKMPDLPRKMFSSTYEIDDLMKIINILSKIYDEKPDYIFHALRFSDISCTFPEYLERVAKAFFSGKKYINDVFNEISNTFKTEELKADKYIIEYIKENPLPKTISEREYIQKTYIHNLEEHMPCELRKNVETSEWLKKSTEKYVREKYMMIAPLNGVTRELSNVKDSIEMFIYKVINPICVFLSNKDDAIFPIVKITLDNFTMFTDSQLLSIPKMIKISKTTHDRMDYFINAGNKPSSLIYYFNDYNPKKYFSTFNNIVEKDTIRKDAKLSTRVEWMPIISESVYNKEKDTYIIPLLSENQLKDEGDAMRHCVGWGGYSIKSSKGQSKIFSIRDNNLKRIATLELKINLEDKKVYINQLYGYNNSQPSKTAEEVSKWFMNEIEKDNIKVFWDEVKYETTNNNSIKLDQTVISHMAGYMPTEENIHDAMIPWKGLLPRSLYNAPFEEWLKFDFIKERIKKINNQKSIEEEINKIRGGTFFHYDDLVMSGIIYN